MQFYWVLHRLDQERRFGYQFAVSNNSISELSAKNSQFKVRRKIIHCVVVCFDKDTS
jgi:hypothetical protein